MVIPISSHQNSDDIVNFWISVGDAMYNPWPLWLKQKIFDILQWLRGIQLKYALYRDRFFLLLSCIFMNNDLLTPYRKHWIHNSLFTFGLKTKE